MAHQREPDLKAKLSRKIAELTMVIHLLFTRNHEREIEVDSLKAAYEHEISVIQEEARGKISWLEGQLDDLEKFRVLLDLKNTESEKDKKQIKTLEGKEVELTRLLTQKDQMLLLAEKQIVELKEKVLHKLKIEDEQAALLTIELESAKQMNSNLKDRLKGKTDRIKKYQSQTENLQSKVSSLQRELNNALESKKKLENSVDGLQGDWLDKINELDERIAQFTKQQQDDHDRMEKLEWRNKQLSQQVKDLDEEKRQLELKIQQYINEQNKKKEAKRSPRPPITRESPDVPRTTPAMDRDEELERLRREIQRYRLELSNRESNFNRMFTDHQPVLLEGKNRKTSSGLIPDGSFPNLSGTRKRSGVHSHLPALGEQRVSGNLSQQQFRGF